MDGLLFALEYRSCLHVTEGDYLVRKDGFRPTRVEVKCSSAILPKVSNMSHAGVARKMEGSYTLNASCEALDITRLFVPITF